MSQNAESKFVNTKNKKFDFFKSCIKKEVWELFCKKFKSDVTAKHHINPICQNFVALRKSVFRKQIFRMYRNIISICKKR